MHCSFSHCQHEGKIINAGEEFVEIKKKYYHSDCRKIMDDIKRIKAMYSDYVGIDKTNFAILSKTINNLIFDKKYETDYIIFALGRHIQERKFLRYPAGLYHIVENIMYKTSWDEKKSNSVITLDILENVEHDFQINKEYNSFEQNDFFE